MKTIERNFKKNPHRAGLLLAFHTAGAHNLDGEVVREVPAKDEAGDKIRAAMKNGTAFQPAWMTSEQDQDLLDLVPVEAPAVDVRTPRQKDFMQKLVAQIAEIDPELGARTEKYISEKSAAGAWVSPARGGDVSQWIDKMIAKLGELRAAVKPTTPVQVADGRYAVEHQGVLKFYRVKNGRVPGFVFLDVQASDETYPIRNRSTISEVLALIAADPDAGPRYGRELGKCCACGRTLTDETSRALGIGPDCRNK